ncbi:12768_t:CDS:2 [Funneliformis caledonium]|uniref:12768_t:CDS:1 n=1 Tax=Funneliformis caledonium TaxID=1117310 RepID=A0A9N8ZS60_9GLOM|nr:12768_t:CDS:2 [Funneliformis caledonium]
MNNDERKKLNMQDNEESILTGPLTLDDILPKERDLTIFVDFLKASKDLSILIANPDISLTLFAPTNSVFRNLTHKPSQVTSQSEDPIEKVQQFALRYVVPSVYSSLSDDELLDTLKEGSKIKVKKNEDGSYKLNGRINTISRLEAENGVVYKIDGILDDE